MCDPSSEPPLCMVAKMSDGQKQEPPRACPVCGVAMMRQVAADGTLIYRCYSCETEIKVRQPTSLVSNFGVSLADELKVGAQRFSDLARRAPNPAVKLRLVGLAEDYLRQADDLNVATS
jgi:hypothetical protein